MAADEEAVLSALASHRAQLIDPLLSEHAGRVANTAGDSLLIEFPSAVSAMRCVTRIQSGMAKRNRTAPAGQRLVYRIGVHVGDVVTSGGDLLGDGVNVAARLEQRAARGEILISRSVRDAVRDRLDLRLEDLGAIEVKNIPRPVRAFRVLPEGMTVAAQPKRGRRFPFPGKAALPGIAAATAVVIATGAWLLLSDRAEDDVAGSTDATALHLGEQSIAVLPFAADGASDADRRLGEGLAEDITGVLSLFGDLSVIASESTAVYEGKGVPPQQIAEDLGVAHVLAGSVERQGDALRIRVNLLDGETGRQVWSQRYDADGADIFSVRDKVARSVAAQLGESSGLLAAGVLARSKRKDTEDLEAYELVLLAADLRHRFNKADDARAAELLERTIQIDPHYAHAHADLAWTHWQDVLNGFTDDPSASFAKAIASAEKAVAADPYFSDAYWVLASVNMCEDDTPGDAVALYRKAIELNPNHQGLLTEWGGYILPQTLNQADEGVALVDRARRLTPRHPDWYDGACVSARLFAERPEDAVRAYASVDQPQLATRVYYAAALGQLGRSEEAQAAIGKLRELKPGFSLSTLAESPELCTGAASDRALSYLRDGLKKAGLPE